MKIEATTMQNIIHFSELVCGCGLNYEALKKCEQNNSLLKNLVHAQSTLVTHELYFKAHNKMTKLRFKNLFIETWYLTLQ